MNIEYDASLVEQAVFLAAKKDDQLDIELHQATDQLYELPDQRERQARFRDVYKSFFQRLGFGDVIPRLLQERPSIEDHVEQCLVCEAPRRKTECAELCVRIGEDSHPVSKGTLFVKLCPSSLLDSTDIVTRLRRELLHVADMLDERFGYQKAALVGHHPRQNLIRDRYRVLWDIFVEGRLFREGHGDKRITRALRDQLVCVFSKIPSSQCTPAFDRLYRAMKLTHSQLLEWASIPERLFGEERASHAGSHGVPGEMCPICGFSTFDWFEEEDACYKIASVVQTVHPRWRTDDGICRQCAEIYIEIARDNDRPIATPLLGS